MNDKLFVIAIGGTGMRCLESFVHLCAIGMFDNQEIDILMLDTDSANGNLGRTERLISLYNQIKSTSNEKLDGGTPNTNTFFSAKLNFYKYCTDYNNPGRITYKNISKLSTGTPQEQEENRLLSNLLLDEKTVQDFQLDHGYRAQTHLGSHLMYHGIIESARKLASGKELSDGDKNLGAFMGSLQQAAENARVFVFGSVFGGTGASSIPIIPTAFRDAIQVRSNGNASLDLSKTKFGSTLLTEYFTFPKPTQAQLDTKEGKVIADSSFFPLNSQAALQFYQQDSTVQSVYKRMYHIGWPLVSKNISEQSANKTITGGKEQKNDCHIVEFLCACAAYDFFTYDKPFNDKAEYLFRAVEFKDNAYEFTGNDFVEKGDVLMNKLGAFLSFSHIAMTLNDGAHGKPGTAGFLRRLKEQKIDDYNTISDDDTKTIDAYLKMFAYEYENDTFCPGWIYQIKRTVEPGTFMFRPEAFPETEKDLKKIDVGAFFLDNSHWWDKGSGISFANDGMRRYDHFVTTLIDSGRPTEDQHVSTTKEKFLAHIYNGITISQKF